MDDAEPKLALDRMNGFRRVRHAVEYGPQDDADEAKVAEALHLAERIIHLAAGHLRHQRPHAALPGVDTGAGRQMGQDPPPGGTPRAPAGVSSVQARQSRLWCNPMPPFGLGNGSRLASRVRTMAP